MEREAKLHRTFVFLPYNATVFTAPRPVAEARQRNPETAGGFQTEASGM